MEKIGYIKKSDLTLNNGINQISLLDDTPIQYGYRNIIEERQDVVQPVCAGVILTQDRQILTFKKHKKALSQYSPEKDKTLLYVGGHIDLEDSEQTNEATFVNGVKREILEELGLEINDNAIAKPMLTYTPYTEKSAKHIGVIYPIVIEKAIELEFADGECQFISIDELASLPNMGEWSKLIMAILLKDMSMEI